MDKYEHRRRALQQLVESLGYGGIAEVAGRIEKQPSYVSRMLYEPGKPGRKRIGEDSWEILGQAYPVLFGDTAAPTRPHLAPVSPPETDSDYVRVEQIDAVGGMGDGVINSDNPEVIRSVEYGAAFIRSLVGFMPPPGRLKLVTGTGDSMRGMIEPGEVLLMDTGVSSFEGDGIYWIGLGDEHDGLQVKMLQRRGDGIYVVSANPFYPEFIFPPDGRIGGKLYIKHKLERFN